MNFTLYVWRQKDAESPGKMVRYEAKNISHEMSFLEMLDVINEELLAKEEDPIAFDHDCREGICGMCGIVINGVAHGPRKGTTTCQLHMRSFRDGQNIYVEPWRAKAFPVIKDLVVDRTAFDRIIESGGFISASTGSAPDGNTILIPKDKVEESMDAAACIACGACVAACPNGSAMLFTSAKVSHLALLPQGEPERKRRVLNMIAAMDEEQFGSCTNHRECEAVCPKEISIRWIAKMNREYLWAWIAGRKATAPAENE